MNRFEAALADTRRTHGDWTAHNIWLDADTYTMRPGTVGDEVKLRRIVQVVQDAAHRPIDRLRILDLACLEGLYAIEFARQGAEAVGIEGRETNLAKARVVKDLLGLDRLHLLQDDVRNLSRERHGTFDVVLCLGILYHLPEPDVFSLLEAMASVCTDLLVVDTHISLDPRISVAHGGNEYLGHRWKEHPDRVGAAEREELLWSSLDNTRSFKPTRASLVNALHRAGFTTVVECHIPAEPHKPGDRITLVGFRGETVRPASTPQFDPASRDAMPETRPSAWRRLLGRKG